MGSLWNRLLDLPTKREVIRVESFGSFVLGGKRAYEIFDAR